MIHCLWQAAHQSFVQYIFVSTGIDLIDRIIGLRNLLSRLCLPGFLFSFIKRFSVLPAREKGESQLCNIRTSSTNPCGFVLAASTITVLN